MCVRLIYCLLACLFYRERRAENNKYSNALKKIEEVEEVINVLQIKQQDSILIGSKQQQLDYLMDKLQYDGKLLSTQVQ